MYNNCKPVYNIFILNMLNFKVKPMKKDHPERYEKERRQLQNIPNSRGSVLSGSSRHSLHPLNKSTSHGSICDNGSDIYVTSAAYRTTSDIR